MIFKYLPYNKQSRQFQDKNIYCSICVIPHLPFSKEFFQSIWKRLVEHKLISFEFPYFHFSNDSQNYDQHIFRISHSTPAKRTTLAQLTQLVDKEKLAKPKISYSSSFGSWTDTITYGGNFDTLRMAGDGYAGVTVTQAQTNTNPTLAWSTRPYNITAPRIVMRQNPQAVVPEAEQAQVLPAPYDDLQAQQRARILDYWNLPAVQAEQQIEVADPVIPVPVLANEQVGFINPAFEIPLPFIEPNV